MDLILYNGQIKTLEDANACFSTLAIKDEKIVQVGNDEIMTLKTEDTQLIDLQGQTLLPGFNDSHMHLLGYGIAKCQVDLSQARSIEDIITMTQDYIQSNQLDKGTWVMGRGWNQDLFATPVMPNANDLDLISTDHFICLRRTCGHVATVNSMVLDTFSLSRALTEVEGGAYENGIFKENAMDLIFNHIPDPTKKEMKSWIEIGAQALIEMGITSVQSDDLCVFPEHMSLTIMDTFIEMGLEKTLSIKVYEQALFRNIKNLNQFINLKYIQNKDFGNFRLGPLKILGDGALGSRTAWLRDGYNDADTKGISMYPQEILNKMILNAHKHNISSATHCIGDAMLDSALDAIERAQHIAPKDLRHGIVHCQITRPDQLQRMKDLNVMAFVQPIFLDYDLHIVNERVGKHLSATSYNWKTMADLSITSAFGSDAPVETPDPLKGMHCAMTRCDLKGNGPYLDGQKLDLYDCLYNYTHKGAYASYEEEYKGLIKENYVADLVLIDGDLNQPLDCTVTMTIINGKIAFKKQ